jgi:hypothetical protein
MISNRLKVREHAIGFLLVGSGSSAQPLIGLRGLVRRLDLGALGVT